MRPTGERLTDNFMEEVQEVGESRFQGKDNISMNKLIKNSR